MTTSCLVCYIIKAVLLFIIAIEILYMIRITRRTKDIEERVLDIIRHIIYEPK